MDDEALDDALDDALDEAPASDGIAGAPVRLTIDELLAAARRDLGPGPWHGVDQATCEAFAEATGDATGATVPPYLLLSLVPVLLAELLEITDKRSGVNYGVESLRFPGPVPVGSRVRLAATLDGAVAVAGGARYTVRLALEAAGTGEPALDGRITYLAYR